MRDGGFSGSPIVGSTSGILIVVAVAVWSQSYHIFVCQWLGLATTITKYFYCNGNVAASVLSMSPGQARAGHTSTTAWQHYTSATGPPYCRFGTTTKLKESFNVHWLKYSLSLFHLKSEILAAAAFFIRLVFSGYWNVIDKRDLNEAQMG